MYGLDHDEIIEFSNNCTRLIEEWDETPLFHIRYAIGFSLWYACETVNATTRICHGDSISIMGTTINNLLIHDCEKSSI